MINKIIHNFKESILGQFTTSLIQLMPKEISLALFLMVLISFTEGFSLILLVPLLQLVGMDVAQGSIGQISQWVSAFFATIGLQPTLISVLIIYVIVISTIAILNRYKSLKTSNIQFKFSSHLRKRLYTSITNSNWLFFSKMKSSNFAHALTNEIERINMGTGQFLNFLSSIMILAVYIIIALKLAGIITGIIFGVGVGILLILRRKASRSKSTGEEITETMQNLYSSIIQHMDGMKTIKSFGMQQENIRVFSNQSNQLAINYLNSIKSYVDVKLLFDIGTVIILSIMVFVLIEVIKLPSASLFLLIYLFVRMIPQFSTIQSSYQYFINMLPAFLNVINLEKECEQAAESRSEIIEIGFNDAITFESVSFSYNTHEKSFKIKNINLKIPKGKTIALVGLSGAGKSTVADLVMGLIKPTTGRILLDNNQLNRNQLDSWRNKIGYVAQDTFLFNETIRYNLILAKKDATSAELWNALKLASSDEFVNNLPEGLDTLLGDRGVRLSGGEKQRLSLARALLKNPDLLIMDEATSNLDSKNEEKILKSIEKLHGDLTILMIAHRLSTIRSADYIYLIESGVLVESGTWSELFEKEKGFFRTIFENQH